MNIQRIAVPAEAEHGLDSPISGHFGHSPLFVISTIKDGKIVGVETLRNMTHASCAEPVMKLAERGVQVLLATGMGMRPFMVTQQVGIEVVRAEGTTVVEAVENFLRGNATKMGTDSLCGGGSHH
ncbi:MAG: NifB/NifX family molybdenum-iron cluster-binding protein [Candidatus Thorarchaeota archaeon]|jgi:predicted Fe-Mo cluster-binding NifX family protein